MLRSEGPRSLLLGLVLAAGVGVIAAALVALGNPGNMGICGACFLRDLAGTVGISKGPAIFRPELAGVVLGATALAVSRRTFVARSGSYAVARFALGVLMSFGALVFLGCPFRLLQRLGGGDLNAWLALPGFVLGVGAGLALERRGYAVGKTSIAPLAVGAIGPLVVLGLLGAFLVGGLLAGPGPGAAGPPLHASWAYALGLSLLAGAALSATGFCAVSAARQVFVRHGRRMLLAAGVLVAAYAATAAATGRLSASFAAPLAHGDWLWSFFGLALVGLAGTLAGGCPVRQMVMAGEGNGDAFVTVMGLTLGGALAHAWGVVSVPSAANTAGGATAAGRISALVGLAIALAYGLAVAQSAKGMAAAATPPPN